MCTNLKAFLYSFFFCYKSHHFITISQVENNLKEKLEKAKLKEQNAASLDEIRFSRLSL